MPLLKFWQDLRDQPSVSVHIAHADGYGLIKGEVRRELLGPVSERLLRFRRINSPKSHPYSRTVLQHVDRVAVADCNDPTGEFPREDRRAIENRAESNRDWAKALWKRHPQEQFDHADAVIGKTFRQV